MCVHHDQGYTGMLLPLKDPGGWQPFNRKMRPGRSAKIVLTDLYEEGHVGSEPLSGYGLIISLSASAHIETVTQHGLTALWKPFAEHRERRIVTTNDQDRSQL